ncbi:hypothetical protein AXF14_11845 [Actinomyces radicidentis]|uniref:LuxR family transcriptional regulator n=1 Tax=Actinomyces radicidentis TaxID=111015 RepID=A0A109W357_ACTRD|nr:response regulator transcription factor [Actinomyces radicidentis]AMD88143.1 hypothetical protein AXF14_11845 [Actinomyces radicidentis]
MVGLPARLLIVDDEPIIRVGLALYLEREDGVEVVAQLPNGAEALDYLRGHEVDLVLLDVRMPIMDGPTALERIAVEHPGVRVLLLTSFDDDEVMYRALMGGGAGYLLKSSRPEEIRAAARAALEGGVPVSPAVNARLVRELAPAGLVRSGTEDFGLSDRERDVLQLLCEAAPNREISRRLCLSESTVKAYVSAIMTKMGCTSRLHVVVTAFEHGLAGRQVS